MELKKPFCLRVYVYQCRGLPAIDGNGLIDPYVKVSNVTYMSQRFLYVFFCYCYGCMYVIICFCVRVCVCVLPSFLLSFSLPTRLLCTLPLLLPSFPFIILSIYLVTHLYLFLYSLRCVLTEQKRKLQQRKALCVPITSSAWNSTTCCRKTYG